MTTVWNLGLPRTGTTSTTEALGRLGFQCRPIVAGWVAEALARRVIPFENRRLAPGDGVLLIASLRPLETWVGSMLAWQPHLDGEYLVRLFEAHAAWLAECYEWPVGVLHVEHGQPSLHRALARALSDHPLPHLNRRAA